jgi:hypothetical protein
MTKISLIIACYNHGRFLEDAVRSILAQTIQDFEIIIVNDASTDDTAKHCTRMLSLDDRVRVITLSKNSGTAIANNSGMSASVGEYITIMSADDMREPSSFEKMLAACIANPHHFVYDNIRLYVDGQKQTKIWLFPEYDFYELLRNNTIHTGIMFERKAFEDTGGYPVEFRNGREDWAFNIMLGMHGYCGVHIDYPGYLYRRGTHNRTLTNGTQEWREKFDQMIRTRYADLYLGRFPMGCCGGRTPVNSVNTRSDTVQAVSLIGAEGMSALEYIGGNYGTATFFGPVTGTAYRFDAAENRLKMVDNRDLTTEKENGLLDLRVHTKKLFQVVPSPEPMVVEEISVIEEIKPKKSTTKKLV